MKTKIETFVLTLVSISFILGVANVAFIAYERHMLTTLALQDIRGLFVDDPQLERLPGKFEDVSMTIQENHQFSLINDTAWADLLPPQRGFVRLGPKGRSFATSTNHQLHCVNALRFSYTVARDGLVTDPDALKSKIPHDNHCFQFLRQTILCKADSSPIKTSNQSLVRAGFGSTHRCRDWGRMRKFIIDNHEQWKDIPYLVEGELLEIDDE